MLVALALTAFAVQRARLPGAVSRPPPASRLAQAELGPWRLPACCCSRWSRWRRWPRRWRPCWRRLTRNLSGGLSLANLTLANFGALFQARGEAWDALSTSLSLAAGAALLAGAVGLLAAWCVAGRHVPAPRH